MGLLSGFLLTPLLGLYGAAAISATAPHRRTLRLTGLVAALLAAGVLVAAIMFSLDVIQFRVQVPPEGQSAYRLGAARAWLKLVLCAAAAGWLALSIRKAARELDQSRG